MSAAPRFGEPAAGQKKTKKTKKGGKRRVVAPAVLEGLAARLESLIEAAAAPTTRRANIVDQWQPKMQAKVNERFNSRIFTTKPARWGMAS